jgi:hypothetical protein
MTGVDQELRLTLVLEESGSVPRPLVVVLDDTVPGTAAVPFTVDSTRGSADALSASWTADMTEILEVYLA